MRRLVLTVLFVLLPLRAPAQGRVDGVVRDGQSEEPLPHAFVSLVGGDAKTRTDDSGRFTLSGLPAGVVDLKIEHDGFAAAVEQIDATGVMHPTFKLFPAATVLDALLVQARAGKHPSRDGAMTTDVRPDENNPAPAPSATAMVARVPGALILSGGQIGSGSIVRLRGVKSLLGSGPPLIYVDGVRVSGGDFRGGSAGGSPMFRRYNEPSVLDQLDPASIDHIVVLPGSAATALYGTGGANGVILVFTKR